jgi:hypothetical protein
MSSVAVSATSRTPIAILVDWYRGEIGGEALFLTLAERSHDAKRAEQWRTLAALEAATRDRLGAALAGLGREPPSALPDPDLAPRRIAELSGLDWRELMRWLERIAIEAHDAMAVDARALPAALAPVADWVLEHERALIDFAIRELTGADDPLQHARSMLSAARG